MESDYAVWNGKITKLLILPALIPPSTAEVERSFSLMKLICTKNDWLTKIYQLLCEFVNTLEKLTIKKS